MSDVVLDIAPVAKPRMTRRDKWKPSVRAKKYFEFANRLRAKAAREHYAITLPLSITFVVEVPKSWSKKKKEKYLGELKDSRPDLDNYIKAFKDALCEEDSGVSHYGEMKKIWGTESKIIIHEQGSK